MQGLWCVGRALRQLGCWSGSRHCGAGALHFPGRLESYLGYGRQLRRSERHGMHLCWFVMWESVVCFQCIYSRLSRLIVCQNNFLDSGTDTKLDPHVHLTIRDSCALQSFSLTLIFIWQHQRCVGRRDRHLPPLNQWDIMTLCCVAQLPYLKSYCSAQSAWLLGIQ